MIPKVGSSSTRSLGKQVYEDDIGKSAFQKFRKEREAAYGRSSDESQSFDFGLDQTTAGAHDDRAAPTHDDLSHSPSLSSSERKRSTNSTSHSEARSSTAATSVASQPVTAAASPAVVPTQPSAPAGSMQTSLKRTDTKNPQALRTRTRSTYAGTAKHPHYHG